MEVRDEDSGANSQLQYFLLGEAGRFSLDQNIGVLTSRSNVGNEGEMSGGRHSKLFSIDPSSGWTGRVA